MSKSMWKRLFIQAKREFCSHCGAGIGVHYRKGEGTCPECDPEWSKHQVPVSKDEYDPDPFINAIDPYR